MAKADRKGIPLEDYLEEHPETFVRNQLDRGELRYTWTDNKGNARASDDGGELPPKGWWPRPEFTWINRERREVRGHALFGPARCFPLGCSPWARRKKPPAVGAPARHHWFWNKRNSDCKAPIGHFTYGEGVKTFWLSFRIGSARRTLKPGQ
jgi:hypothetical protein